MASAAAITQLIEVAAREVEQLTGYNPFLGDAGTKRVRQARVMRLPNGVYGTITLELSDVPLVAEVDYRMGPVHADGASGDPYDWIELIRPVGSIPIEVTGTWGYADDYPNVLKIAIIELVAGRYIESQRQGQVAEGNWKESDSSRDVVGGSTLGGKETELGGGAMISRAIGIIKGYRRHVGFA